MTPPWLDQVLFDLQGLKPDQLSPWEREFLPSVSLQLAKHGRLTDPQLRSLKRMYSRLFPQANIKNFERFSEQEVRENERKRINLLNPLKDDDDCPF